MEGDLSFLISSISNIGFPIVACLAMYHMCNVTLDKINGTLERHTDMLKELKEVITKNEG